MVIYLHARGKEPRLSPGEIAWNETKANSNIFSVYCRMGAPRRRVVDNETREGLSTVKE